jgi:phosphoribosyl-ATP pyrophosphohydrolase/phosphoribosyl-AMP cyclohydrolase
MITVPETLRFDANGLIPAIAQDADDGQVLMFAYMNAEAVAQTLETGLAHYYSRSRGRLWRKGEESGHVQRVREIRYDCDEDALLLKVEQEVAACHTGHRSCFYRHLPGAAAGEPDAPTRRFDPATVYGGLGVLLEIYATIRDRQVRRPEGSYVASLFAKGADEILKKMAEESAEVLLAAKGGNRDQLAYEMADLWFHSLVVLAEYEIRPEEIARELGRRIGKQKPDYASPPGDPSQSRNAVDNIPPQA